MCIICWWVLLDWIKRLAGAKQDVELKASQGVKRRVRVWTPGRLGAQEPHDLICCRSAAARGSAW